MNRINGLLMRRYGRLDCAVRLDTFFNSSHKAGDKAPFRNTYKRVIGIEGGQPRANCSSEMAIPEPGSSTGLVLLQR